MALGFQRGLMLWRGDGRQRYVFVADGRAMTRFIYKQ